MTGASQRPADIAAASAVAAEELGIARLRPAQVEAIEHLVAGRDVVLVMPTGAGKSAVYQVAGRLIRGSTLVIAPLLALQKDQVDAVGDRLGGAVACNSSLTESERGEVLDRFAAGDVEFLLMAPEQVTREDTLAALLRRPPSLVVVDEAHCISSWGHDFRPDYLALGGAIEALGHPTTVALTATAAPPVRREIVEQLRLREPRSIIGGFERSNIAIAVDRTTDTRRMLDRVVELVRDTAGTGLVYVARRRIADDVAQRLDSTARPAMAYHAGLAGPERSAVHERFLEEEPAVVVATNAFGMGIDAPHVRFVVHAGAPESLDAYYQEIGRAGRDGRPAVASLVAVGGGPSDRQRLSGSARLDPGAVVDATQLLATRRSSSCAALGGRVRGRVVADELVRAGAAVDDGPTEVRWTGALTVEDAAAAVVAANERSVALDRTRREMVDRFVAGTGCRWQFLVGYFGEPMNTGCGHCDNCANGRAATDAPEGPAPSDLFAVGTTVTHARWGRGTVSGCEQDVLTVLFDEAGYRTLLLPLVVEQGLLLPAA